MPTFSNMTVSSDPHCTCSKFHNHFSRGPGFFLAKHELAGKESSTLHIWLWGFNIHLPFMMPLSLLVPWRLAGWWSELVKGRGCSMHNNALRNLGCMANIYVYIYRWNIWWCSHGGLYNTALTSKGNFRTLPSSRASQCEPSAGVYILLDFCPARKDQTLFTLRLVWIVSVSITQGPLHVHTTIFFFSSAKWGAIKRVPCSQNGDSFL